MKKRLIALLLLILCFSLFVGCENPLLKNDESTSDNSSANTTCEHDDLERISNLNESTARYKCKNCGEILLTTDPESLPKTYTFSGSFSIAPMNNEANTRVCMGDTILNILNRGSWEKGALASNYDYIFLIGDALLHYDSSKGLFMYTKDATSLITSDTDRMTINYLINSMFVRESIPDLNMATLISLVDIYGENVTWDTFAPYYYEEIGSGLHILRYPIVDANFYLLIGGSSPYTSPMYIRLVSEIDGSYIDIRTDSIREFIGMESADFEPGVILLELNEPTGDICELFPELDIAQAKDTYLELYELYMCMSSIPPEVIENVKNKIGTSFIIKLNEISKEAVIEGIKSIIHSPVIADVSPNYIMHPQSHANG